MNRADEIKAILEEATRAAYERGWLDCVAAFREAARNRNDMRPDGRRRLLDNATVGLKPEQDQAADLFMVSQKNTAADVVLNTIRAIPGQTGAALAARVPHIPERTVRTALRRLRLSGRIEQRGEGEWYLRQGASGG